MLSLRDCLDYCNLVDEDVALFAEHESLSEAIAAHLLCAMVQTQEGVSVIIHYFEELETHAQNHGNMVLAERARLAQKRFRQRQKSI